MSTTAMGLEETAELPDLVQGLQAPRSRATTWNAPMASEARMLENQGVAPQEIFRRTGTWRGQDGKLRQQLRASTLAGYMQGAGEGMGGVLASIVTNIRDIPRGMLGLSPTVPTSPSEMYRIAATPMPALGAVGMATRRVPKSVASVFDAVDDVETARRMALRGEHLKRTAEGKYIGAPADVDSPQKLARNRLNALRRVEEGAFNANWYDRARAAAEDITGFNQSTMGFGLQTPESRMASLFARGGAAYSPQATPEQEVGAFLRQHNAQVLRGQLVQPRTGSQMRNVARAYEPNTEGGYDLSPEDIKLGKKTGPYADAKDPTVDPASLYKTANDIWHGRVMGYGENFSRGFTPQEHGFLTGENLVLAEEAQRRGFGAGILPEGYQWNPRSAQAATWGSQRVAQYKKEYQEAVRKARKEGRKPPIEPTEQEYRDRAMYGIDSAVPRYRADDTFEFVTGENTGHLAGLNRMDEATRTAYTDAMGDAYLGPMRRDPIYESMQMYQSPALGTAGKYENSAGVVETNKGFTSRPLVSLQSSDLGRTAKGKVRRGGPQIVPEDDKAMRAAGLFRGFVTGQEATGRNKFTPANKSMKLAEKTGARYEGPDLEVARKAFEDEGLDVVQVGDALHVGKYPNDDGTVSLTGAQIQTAAKRAAKGLQGSATPGRLEFGLETVPWTKQPGTGETTRAVLEKLTNDPNYFVQNFAQRIDAGRVPKIAAVFNDIDEALAKKTNLPLRQDLLMLRKMLSEEGLQGIIRYVQRTGGAGLPAVALLPSLSSPLSERDER